MVTRRRALILVAPLLSLAGCGLFGDPAASPPPEPSIARPSPTAGAGSTPVETSDFVATVSPGATASPAATEPSDDLGPFNCELPITGGGSTERANIVDVRVGEHTGFDRIVFEFEGGIPEYEIEEASPPFIEDPRGEEVEVRGDAHLQLTLRGGTKQGDDGTSTYPGRTTFYAGFRQLVQLEETSDFEAQAIWVIGMSGDTCVRVLTLSGPDRLVIDLEHP